MPEGDTVFRTARTLHLALAGRKVVRFEARTAGLSRADEARPVEGRTVEAVSALGKHCLLRFSGDLVLHTHLGMQGAWHVYRPAERWRRSRARMRVCVGVADFVAVGFDLPVAALRSARDLERSPVLRALGPDLLAADFDVAEAVRRLGARPDVPLGEALLDQRALAGIGNVFKSEICFLAGAAPHAPVATLGDGALARIVEIARRLLRANVAAPSAGLRRTTGRLDPAARLFVYGRAGAPCRRCGDPIAFSKDGRDARVTYWCRRCQPAPLAAAP